jgi:hypothetical protein
VPADADIVITAGTLSRAARPDLHPTTGIRLPGRAQFSRQGGSASQSKACSEHEEPPERDEHTSKVREVDSRHGRHGKAEQPHSGEPRPGPLGVQGNVLLGGGGRLHLT